MINIETVKFINMLDRLAKLSKNGIEDFKNATEKNAKDKIFYNKKLVDGEEGYRVVLDMCILDDPECRHHDCVSYYDSDTNEYKVRVIIEEDEAPYIIVKFAWSSEEIVVENGQWYITQVATGLE